MNSCINCGGAILQQGKVYGYAGPVCYCAEPKPRTPYYVHAGLPHPGSGGGGGYVSPETAMILKEIAALKEEIKCEERRFNQLWDQFAALDKVNQELVEALEEIAEWTERYTSAGHPISTVARAILAKHKEQV